MKKIEILAPAGSYEGMKAAMNAGCDAVYIGGSSFGARAYADNLKEDTLLRAIDEAHIRDKKLYLTVNTLLKEKELTERLYSFLEKYYLEGLDAVIVQDVGVMHFIHRNFPGLPIHASTQMTLTMAQGANLLKDNGVTRLVTSRELSFSEIKNIRENTELEIETFVHGALCYCYSGQCLMSSMIGGRSGNRGRCAQPCRMPYQFYLDGKKVSQSQEKYLLSPKDINTIERIPELVEAGVNSFKIEGRMKRPEYAAGVAAMYRKYVDLYFAHGREAFHTILEGKEYEKDMLELLDVYNRGGFSGGYGSDYHGKSMMSLYRPNHSGVYVGEVMKVMGSKISIRLTGELHAQDILEIRLNKEEGYEFTVKDPHKAGDILETNVGIRRDASAKEAKQMPGIRGGMSVYRTRNNLLLETISREYMEKDRKLGVKGHLTARLGEQLKLTIIYKEFTASAYQDIVQEAVKQPITKEKLAASVSKTGDTLFYFEDLVIDTEDNIFVPVAWLNDIRREAINSLTNVITGHYRREIGEMQEDGSNEFEIPFVPLPSDKRNYGIMVSVQTQEQYETALSFPEITQINADYDRFETLRLAELAQKAGESGKCFYLALPLICRQSVYAGLEKELDEIIDNKWITGFVVKNFEEISLLRSFWNKGRSMKEVILNYNMYVGNKEARSFWREKGIIHYSAPVEWNYQELKQLGMKDCDIMVYGYLPLMVSAQCLLESTVGCKKCRQNQKGFLTDRLGKKFFVQTNCSSCYNIIYNGQALALHKQSEEITGLGPQNIRLDFTMESAAEMKQIIRIFIDSYRYGKKNSEGLSEYTTGHFKRGIE